MQKNPEMICLLWPSQTHHAEKSGSSSALIISKWALLNLRKKVLNRENSQKLLSLTNNFTINPWYRYGTYFSIYFDFQIEFRPMLHKISPKCKPSSYEKTFQKLYIRISNTYVFQRNLAIIYYSNLLTHHVYSTLKRWCVCRVEE